MYTKMVITRGDSEGERRKKRGTTRLSRMISGVVERRETIDSAVTKNGGRWYRYWSSRLAGGCFRGTDYCS